MKPLPRCVIASAAFAPFLCACSGARPLSDAIAPSDENAYLERLNAANHNGRQAWFALKSAEENVPISELQRRDDALSTTRNPFDAYKAPRAVSRGAVI